MIFVFSTVYSIISGKVNTGKEKKFEKDWDMMCFFVNLHLT